MCRHALQLSRSLWSARRDGGCEACCRVGSAQHNSVPGHWRHGVQCAMSGCRWVYVFRTRTGDTVEWVVRRGHPAARPPGRRCGRPCRRHGCVLASASSWRWSCSLSRLPRASCVGRCRLAGAGRHGQARAGCRCRQGGGGVRGRPRRRPRGRRRQGTRSTAAAPAIQPLHQLLKGRVLDALQQRCICRAAHPATNMRLRSAPGGASSLAGAAPTCPGQCSRMRLPSRRRMGSSRWQSLQAGPGRRRA